MALKIKIKKNTLVRKIDGVKKTGYYGIVKASTHGSTLDFREAELACKMMIDGIVENLRNGYIVDLGVLGTIYPAVTGKWDEDAENLQLSDMKPKVNYKPGADIDAAIKGAQLSWTTEKETDENTVSDSDQTDPGTGGGSGSDLEG